MNYQEIYIICEELQKLGGSQLQEVRSPQPNAIYLGFRLPGETKWMLLDLSPAQPFVTCLSQIQPPKKLSKTPIVNFLKAHFVKLIFQKIEIAEKPNRTIRVYFSNKLKNSILEFRCFPHGQQIILTSDGKIVSYPKRPRDSDGVISYVEPEKKEGWEYCEKYAPTTSQTQAIKKVPVDKEQKLQESFKRAIAKIDTALETSVKSDEEKIKLLKLKAQEIISSGKSKGRELDTIYDEIKEIKGKRLKMQAKRNQLIDQMNSIEKKVDDAGSEPTDKSNQNSHQDGFKGLRVTLRPGWELWVGKTAIQNDELLRLANSNDLWIHLRDYPGAHGILRGPKNAEPPESILQDSLNLVATVSQTRKRLFSEGEKLDYIVAQRKFVKKPKGAPPGQVIVERETVRRAAFKKSPWIK